MNRGPARQPQECIAGFDRITVAVAADDFAGRAGIGLRAIDLLGRKDCIGRILPVCGRRGPEAPAREQTFDADRAGGPVDFFVAFATPAAIHPDRIDRGLHDALVRPVVDIRNCLNERGGAEFFRGSQQRGVGIARHYRCLDLQHDIAGVDARSTQCTVTPNSSSPLMIAQVSGLRPR